MAADASGGHNPLWELRAKLFDRDPAGLGLEPSEALPRVWGLLMESGHKEGPVSLIVLANGTVSLYFPTGGGFIGMGTHKPVWAAAFSFLQTGEAVFDSIDQPGDRGFPAEGQLRFHLLSFSGPRMAGGVKLATVRGPSRSSAGRDRRSFVRSDRFRNQAKMADRSLDARRSVIAAGVVVGTTSSGSRHSNAPGVLVAPRQVRRRRRPIANLDHRHRERPDPHLERAGWDRTLHPAKDNCLGELQ